MKLIFAVLFLCSAAFPQEGTMSQSSEHPSYSFTLETQVGILKDKSIAVLNGHKKVVSINTETGEVTYGEGVTPSEASRQFYEAVGLAFKDNNCAAREGAQPEASGKPDSEKTKKRRKAEASR